MKMKRGILSLSVLLALLVTLVMPVAAADEPTPAYHPEPVFPTTFYGSITVNSAPAPVGTLIAGEIIGSSSQLANNPVRVTTEGKYGGPGGTDDKLVVQTDDPADLDENNPKTIRFWVKLPGWKNFIEANETAEYDCSIRKRLDLTAEGDGGSTGGNGGGGGGGGAVTASARIRTINADIFGTIVKVLISPDDRIVETVTFASPDSAMTITLPAGTLVKEAAGNSLSFLRWDWNSSPPPSPIGASIITAFDLEPNRATFTPPLTFTFSFDPSRLPDGIEGEDLALTYYDEKTGKWVNLTGSVDPGSHQLTAAIPHFTVFAVTGYPKPPTPIKDTPVPEAAPAAFSLSGLSVQPSTVKSGEKVTVSVVVSNTGGKEGSHTVSLLVNGVKEQEKSVTVPPGSQKTVVFEISKDQAGDYTVSIGSLTASFTVEEVPLPPASLADVTRPFNWALTGGILGAVVIVSSAAVLWLRRRKIA